jgi:hypothetical protein
VIYDIDNGEMEPIARVNFATAKILTARMTANQADHRCAA